MADLAVLYPDAHRFKFGDNRRLCETLTALVLAGKKTATCWPLADTQIGEPMLSPGDIAIYTDWDAVPVVAVEFTSIEIMAFNEVPESYALAEGENDSLDGWRRDHRTYFERNRGWAADMMLVCERFRVVERASGGPP